MRLTPAADAMESSAINELVAVCLAQQAEIERMLAELAAKNTEILQLRQAYVRLQNKIYEENNDA